MPNVSFQVDEETKSDLERAMTVAKFNNEIPDDYNQSDVLRMLVTDFINQHTPAENEEGNKQATMAPTAD